MAGSTLLKANYELMPYPKLKASLNFTADRRSQNYELVRTGQRRVKLAVFGTDLIVDDTDTDYQCPCCSSPTTIY